VAISLFMMFYNVFGKLNYMMQMNQRQWMYGDRRTSEYTEGLRNFGDMARANIQNGFMCYTCVAVRTRRYTLPEKGFMLNYNC
jgi:hypothetical protein